MSLDFDMSAEDRKTEFGQDIDRTPTFVEVRTTTHSHLFYKPRESGYILRRPGDFAWRCKSEAWRCHLSPSTRLILSRLHKSSAPWLLAMGALRGLVLVVLSQRPLSLPERRQCSVACLNSEVRRSTAPVTDATRPWGLLLMQRRSQDGLRERGFRFVGTTVDLGTTYTVLIVSPALFWKSYALFGEQRSARSIPYQLSLRLLFLPEHSHWQRWRPSVTQR
jgi:hypothetical protein